MTKRIGMIVPSSNTTAEPVTTALTAGLYPKVSLHYTRIGVTQISLDAKSQQQFELSNMLAAARLLADAGVDVIAWNGTSGAWRGVEADHAICDAITRELSVPATTGTIAQLEAFRAYGVTRFAMAVPYLPSVRDLMLTVYRSAGFECVSSALLKSPIEINSAFAKVPADEIRDLVARSDVAEAEGIAIICTNFPAAWLVEELETRHGKPIFDSTILVAWHALRLAGVTDAVPGWGRLMREPAGGAIVP